MARFPAALWMVLALAAPAVQAASDDGRAPPGVAEWRRFLTWEPGEDSFLRLRGWLLLDAVSFPRTEVGYGASRHTGLALRSARLSARGQLLGDWAARVDLELAEANPNAQEAWVEWCALDALRLRAGRIRVPFGLAQQEPVWSLRLQEAPMVAGNPKDFRDLGLMLHGRLWEGRLEYAVALVTGSRDVAVDVNETPDGVVRLLWFPLVGLGPWLEGWHLGASGGAGAGPTRHGFRGRTTGDFTFFPPPTVRGSQWRAGGELGWEAPGLRLALEYQWLWQERDGVTALQRIGSTSVQVGDLSPYRVSGYSAELDWLFWGEPGVEAPERGLELCLRWEWLEFGDGRRLLPVTGGQEDHAPLDDSWVHAVSAGLNGYPAPGVRLGLTYQGVQFGRRTLAPDYQTADPPEPADALHASGFVHHVYARLAFLY